MTEDHRLQPARELFFTYDGSRFYMSRDGLEEDYLRFAVPREVEKAWLEEPTATKLQGLGEPGNWTSIYFLCHHNDTRHLHAVLHAEPLGDAFCSVPILNRCSTTPNCVGTPIPATISVVQRSPCSRKLAARQPRP